MTNRFPSSMPAIVLFWLAGSLLAQTISQAEYVARRGVALDRLQNGILLLHAQNGPKKMEQPGWVQDASFYYFTGLANLPEAILALDGPLGEARLFVPEAPLFFGVPVADLVPEAGEPSARTHGLHAIEPWEEFTAYMKKRIRAGVRRIYLDEARLPERTGVPKSMWPVAGEKTLWKQSLLHAFPEVELVSAVDVIRELRWVKSRAEVEILRANARATAAALVDGIKRIRPGVTQREAEAAVVAGCIAAGAQGPSFWPWLMSGPNTTFQRLVRSFYDYEHLNRTMQAGELVRADVGCAGGGYGGDVGRTVPVSGKFSTQQQAVWDLLVAGYRGGLEAMKPGASQAEVVDAAQAKISQSSLNGSAFAASIVAEMLDSQTGVNWHVHGVGIESGETALDILEKSTVVAFEPMFLFASEGYYLEDMILITDNGHEVLSIGLPYTAREIEEAMRR